MEGHIGLLGWVRYFVLYLDVFVIPFRPENRQESGFQPLALYPKCLFHFSMLRCASFWRSLGGLTPEHQSSQLPKIIATWLRSTTLRLLQISAASIKHCA